MEHSNEYQLLKEASPEERQILMAMWRRKGRDFSEVLAQVEADERGEQNQTPELADIEAEEERIRNQVMGDPVDWSSIDPSQPKFNIVDLEPVAEEQSVSDPQLSAGQHVHVTVKAPQVVVVEPTAAQETPAEKQTGENEGLLEQLASLLSKVVANYPKAKMPREQSGKLNGLPYQLRLPSIGSQSRIAMRDAVRNSGLNINEIPDEYLESVDQGGMYNVVGNLDDLDGNYTNDMRFEGSSLNPAFIRDGGAPGKLTGQRAQLAAISHRSQGRGNAVPLWNSGFWVTFSPAGDSDIYEIQQRIINETMDFGRDTYGAAFEQSSSLITELLVNFALANVLSCSLPSVADIRPNLSMFDIPVLLTGFAATLYPRGFDYSRRCIASPDNCQHEIQASMDLNTMILADENRITEKMRRHMLTRKPGSHTPESLIEYRNELKKSAPDALLIVSPGEPQEMQIQLRTPTAEEFLSEGSNWLSQVRSSVLVNVTAEGTPQQKKQDYDNQLTVSYLRNYAHWVDQIQFNESVISDREDIANVLAGLSSDDEVIKVLTEGVRKFHLKSLAAIVGIHTYTCPSCGKLQPGVKHNENFSCYIPLEVNELFFDLLHQRYLKSLGVV